MSGATRQHIAALGAQLARLESVATPAERERARALAHALLEAHRAGLARLLEIAAPGEAGAALLERLCADADVAALLMLHGLHPVGLRTRVEQAVAQLAPRLAAQHAQLQLLGIDSDGVVRLRVEHAGAQGALHEILEEALALAAADAPDVRIEEHISVPVSLERLGRKAAG